MRYEAKPGDTYETISSKSYGTKAYWRALVEYNRQHPQRTGNARTDGQLAPGEVVWIPDIPVLEADHRDLILDLQAPAGSGPGTNSVTATGIPGSAVTGRP
jgi:hypothetical protein